jgi:hypothetical protein
VYRNQLLSAKKKKGRSGQESRIEGRREEKARREHRERRKEEKSGMS